MDRLQTMKVFLAVVDEGGFTAAARHLDMSVPSVTRLVADLENHLGTRLLQRTTRRLHPTPAGLQYAQSVRHIWKWWIPLLPMPKAAPKPCAVICA